MKLKAQSETTMKMNMIEEEYEEESKNEVQVLDIDNSDFINDEDEDISSEVLNTSRTQENSNRPHINLRGLILCADDQLINIEILKQHLDQLG